MSMDVVPGQEGFFRTDSGCGITSQSAGSDRGSDGSCGLLGSVGSNGEDRGVAASAARNSALAKLRERQSKCVQALRSRPSVNLQPGQLPQTGPLTPNGQASGGLLPGMDRQESMESSMGFASASMPVQPLELSKALQELREQQEASTENFEEAMESINSTEKACQETVEQVASIKTLLSTQSQELQALRSGGTSEAAQLEELRRGFASQVAELERITAEVQVRQKDFKALFELGGSSVQETSQQLSSLQKSCASQAALLEQSTNDVGQLQRAMQAQAAVLEELRGQAVTQRLGDFGKALDTQTRQIEALRAEDSGRHLGELSRVLELQSRHLESIRAQEAGEHLQELQRCIEAQARQLESLRSQDAMQSSEIQRILETNTTQLQRITTQETGQHLIELQRIMETQGRSIESIRSQDQQLADLRKSTDLLSSQVLEALQARDPGLRLAELKRVLEAQEELLSDLKPKAKETSSGIAALTTTVSAQTGRVEELAGKVQSQAQEQLGELVSLRAEMEKVSMSAQSQAALLQDVEVEISRLRSSTSHEDLSQNLANLQYSMEAQAATAREVSPQLQRL
mmetsp:Transcript_7181/g.12861  ORF Transcript_7181/g.12861 Transcript_7181/m.12861 type:complete len:575 (-) Transcript_7181:1-1725(-)